MPTVEPEYISNLEILVKARTEQLRTALHQQELMLRALRSVVKAESLEQARQIAQAELERDANRTLEEPPQFGGKPGEPVPQVSAEDLRAAWECFEKVRRESSGHVGIEIGIFQNLCKPGADANAVVYRAQQLVLAFMFAQELLAKFEKEKLFLAAATVPMEWPEVGVIRNSPPYDFNEFLSLCA